jgi:hypothetical protein
VVGVSEIDAVNIGLPNEELLSSSVSLSHVLRSSGQGVSFDDDAGGETEWWLRPVSRAARVGEQSAVV